MAARAKWGRVVVDVDLRRPRHPVDPTAGEVPIVEFRGMVRRIADVVGKVVAAEISVDAASGRRQVSDDEKVRSVTAIQAELQRVNAARLGRGMNPLSTSASQALIDAVMAHVYGLGELEVLWTHPDVEEIDINGADHVFVVFAGGEKVRWTPIASDDDELIELTRRACRRLSLNEVEFDARHPQLDLQLPDGSRLFAVFGGSSGNGVAKRPCVAIRRHRYQTPSRDDLLSWGVMPETALDFLISALRHGENVIVAGDHFAGKTTLLRAICFEAIAPDERVITIEAGLTELGLDNGDRLHDVVTMFSRTASAEGEGEVPVVALVRHASRRLNPMRVIVGEVLGDEVAAVLDVFSGSTHGSACTIHARSARGAARRFEQYGMNAQPPVMPEAIHYALAEAAPVVVHLATSTTTDGMRRYATSIVEVTGELEGGRVAMTELWGVGPDGMTLEPKHPLSQARRGRMERHGWSWQRSGWVPTSMNGEVRR